MSADVMTTGLPLPENPPKTSKHRRQVAEVEQVAGTINNLNGSMGITGFAKNFMNMTSMVILAAVAVFFIYFFVGVFKEQQATFQANLKELRDEHAKDRADHAKDREAMNEVNRSLRLLVNELRKQRGANPIDFDASRIGSMADPVPAKPDGGGQ